MNALILNQGFTHSTTIENDVLIAFGEIILKGCHIGIGSAIREGSVFTKDVLPHSVVFMIPAKAISESQ